MPAHPESPSRVIVGMSGGVDSSVSALLLQRQGYSVEGLFMKNWEEDDSATHCAAAEDLADTRAVCARLGIELHTVNFASEYWDQVFSHFLDEYRAGRTPNPDVLCNREIKFSAFSDFARSLGARYVATGHYARLCRDAGGLTLVRGADPGKDQTYFLHSLSQAQLEHVLFPVGALHKAQVRRLARDAGLDVSEKKDSTGICFVGERDFTAFLAGYLPARPGDIVDPQGQRLGTHQGLMFYTIGQRKGLAIGGLAERAQAPWYVIDKRIADNTLVVAQGHDHPRLLSSALSASKAHWIDGNAPALPLRCSAKIRYRQRDVACTVQARAAGLRVEFDAPVRAVTPGQSIVFYRGVACLGGAVID